MGTNKHDEWFQGFVRNFPGAELVNDALTPLALAKKPRNADYFFENRRFIAELKSFETSKMPSIQAVIDELRNKGELPIFYHEAPVYEVIKDHPDQKRLNKRFLMKIAEKFEDDFRKANSQIRETKAIFNLPTAKGIILITNTELPEVSLKLAWNELSRLIIRKRGNVFAYEQIDLAIYLQDLEVREITKNYAQQPVPVIFRNEDPELSAFSNRLLAGIARTKGFDFLNLEGDTASVLDSTTPHKRLNPPTLEPMTRSEFWHQRYLQKRTYRHLTDDDLARRLAQFILEEYFIIKNGKISVAEENRDYVGETVEGFITECELRYLDMRKVYEQREILIDQGLAKGEVAEFLRCSKGTN